MQGLKLLHIEIEIPEVLQVHWNRSHESILESLRDLCARKFESFSLRGLPFELDRVTE